MMRPPRVEYYPVFYYPVSRKTGSTVTGFPDRERATKYGRRMGRLGYHFVVLVKVTRKGRHYR